MRYPSGEGFPAKHKQVRCCTYSYSVVDDLPIRNLLKPGRGSRYHPAFGFHKPKIIVSVFCFIFALELMVAFGSGASLRGSI